ncbi:MAG TPA: YidC/Oxa1 family membrane protein insertase [Ktedonobacteraceae bacterium]|nr:YidC/Oxa1 family membrane protein insertase [Ktedonobacteraceae bacterium]
MAQIGTFFGYIFTDPIFNVLMLLYHLFGDLGLSIIVLTVVIRLLLFPLYMKQLKSSKAMQAIQPLIADVKKQYPKDQRAQYQAMQEVYKEYGVSPAAGCLPLLIQLPVLYGMFFALRAVLNAHGLPDVNNIIYPFLPKFAVLPSVNLTWFGLNLNLGKPDPSHILPVLAGVATFLQLRMSQPRNAAGAKNAMTQQMQIMQFIMPFVTFFFALNFPAGLALYWTTTSVFSMVQQYFVTGWGSLTEMPSFLQNILPSRSNGGSRTYTGDQRKAAQIQQKADEPEAEVVGSNGRRDLKPQSNSYANGSSPARRRSRNNSASARRRGNAPKRNPSRK